MIPFPGVVRHYSGYSDARAKVEKYDLKGLLNLIDNLYGRDNLKYGDGIDEVRAEALNQLEREWRIAEPRV